MAGSGVPAEIHEAIDRAMGRVAELFMASIDEAVRPLGAHNPVNVAAGMQAIHAALERIEAALLAVSSAPEGEKKPPPI